MQNRFKKVLTSLLLVLVIFVSCGCSSLSLSSQLNLEPNSSELNVESLLPTNGVDGKDGKDGDTVDLYEVYEKLVELGEYTGTYAEFVKDYLSIEDSEYTANSGLNSVVSIVAGFTSSVTYQSGPLTTETFETKGYGAGSGVIFRLDKEKGDATIITNYHVIYDNDSSPAVSSEINLFLYGQEDYSINTLDSITVGWNTYSYKQLSSDKKITASFLGGSLLYDIAVLKVSGSEILKNSDAKEAVFADSNHLSVGEKTIAIGNASSLGLSATEGIVSVDSEYISMTGADGVTPCTFRVLRTDTAINGGNSGGGLFNREGEIIGIVNAKITSSTIENIGYAIPSNVASAVAENIIRNCDGDTRTTVKRCILGINVMAKNSSAVQTIKNGKLKTEIVETVSISNITAGTPADGKLEVRDILTSVTVNYASGKTLTLKPTRTFHLVDLSLTLSVGDNLILSITDEFGNEKADVSITFTPQDLVEYA